MYLALWLIRRWRLPATPCLILPVAVSLKRFLTPLLVLSLGISSPDVLERPRQPFWPGAFCCFQKLEERGPIETDQRSGKVTRAARSRPAEGNARCRRSSTER